MPRYHHLFLDGPTDTRPFSHPSGGGGTARPAVDRAAHAAKIRLRLEASFDEDEQRRVAATSDRHGTYLMFSSEPGFDLALKSLEAKRLGIRLMNVKEEGLPRQETTRATVYVPRVAMAHFLKKVSQYQQQDTRGKEPKPMNAPLIESIADVRLAVLEAGFWMDARGQIPGDTPDWVEAWLSSADLAVIERFTALCSRLDIQIGQGNLTFPERTVILACATRTQLVQLIEHSDDIAEFRAAREVASFFTSEPNRDQVHWVEHLLERMVTDRHDEVAVLVLDHGVNNGHRLLEHLLANDDRHTVDPAWGRNDHHGHGTLMAGTAGYGDLLTVLQGYEPVRITHCLESAKILPPSAANPKHLWGLRTADGISRAEIQSHQRKRVVCMAVTGKDVGDRGRPSSWSGKVDELASGYEDDKRRLIIVSAGNVEGDADWQSYPEANKTAEVQDPAQAWNALSVGAYTEKTRLVDPTMAGWNPIAEAGGLSPFSSTSLTWPPRRWPIKPEVLFEGGNVAKHPDGRVTEHDDLCLLSTSWMPQIKQFAAFNATSAASALAAWMAAKIQAAYREAWPETVRGLIVHTAEWTDTQRRDFLTDESKGGYARLARVCGYGVPDLERALYCANNSLTLIAQQEIQPFDKHASRYISNEMHLYRVPWPVDVLRNLGETPVRMRVTLSYFIEPSPGEVGWQDRYRYASHALRFELNGPGESETEFVQRINAKEREGGRHPGTEGASDHWTLGEARDVGSVHSDIWRGKAVELAASNLLIVHPAVGWWRERQHLGRWNRRTRYSLIISIHLPGQEVDIYTPVAIQIGVRVPVPVAIPIV